MASTFAGSRPSEKLGTHSISRFIVLAFCPAVPANYSAVSVFCAAEWAVHTRTLAYSDKLRHRGLGQPELAFARACLTLVQGGGARLQAHVAPSERADATAARSSASCSG